MGSQFSPTHARIKPVSLSWKAEVSTTGPPGNSQCHISFLTRHIWRTLGTHGCGSGSHQSGTFQLPSSCISRSVASDPSTRGGGTRPRTPGQSEPGMPVAALVCPSWGHMNQLLLSKSGPKNSFRLIWDLTRHSPLVIHRRETLCHWGHCLWTGENAADQQREAGVGWTQRPPGPRSLQPAPATRPATGLDKLIHSPPSPYFFPSA